MRLQRGTALPETALVLTLLLSLLAGALRVALFGYAQVAADAVAFWDSHETAVKTTYPDIASGLNPPSAAQAAVPPFPTNQNGSLSSAQLVPPIPQVATAYGFDQPDNRHGGVSMLEPLQVFATATTTNLQSFLLFGPQSVLTVTGVSVDPAFLETGVHGNIQGNQFGTSAAANAAVDYFDSGENTPPYFAGFHYLQYCNLPNDPTLARTWNNCAGGIEYLGLGMAEYLDNDNWGRPTMGVSPATTAVFWETMYHQQVYANLTSALPPDISSAADLSQAQAVLDSGNAIPGNTQNGDILKVYSWDSAQQGGYPPPDYSPGQYPLTPGAGYSGS